MSYTQLTAHERYVIASFRLRGHTLANIARRIGRSPGTVCRELQRNADPRNPVLSGTLSPEPGRNQNRKPPSFIGRGFPAKGRQEAFHGCRASEKLLLLLRDPDNKLSGPPP